MIDIFSTREMATAIWFILILIYGLFKKNIRQSTINLIKCACTHKLSIPFIGIIYTGILVFIAQHFSVWSWIYIKDIRIFTFNIIVEIILIPLITIISIMNILADREEYSKQIKKLMSITLLIIGIIIIWLSVKELIHISDIEEIKALVISFMIPIIFSLLYLPVAYIFAIFSRYETLFLRMSFKSPNNIMRKSYRHVVIAVR